MEEEADATRRGLEIRRRDPGPAEGGGEKQGSKALVVGVCGRDALRACLTPSQLAALAGERGPQPEPVSAGALPKSVRASLLLLLLLLLLLRCCCWRCGWGPGRVRVSGRCVLRRARQPSAPPAAVAGRA